MSEKCPQGDGVYVDPNSNCQNYYLCNYSGTNFETIAQYSCPAGLLFDETSKNCNWAHLVTCTIASYSTVSITTQASSSSSSITEQIVTDEPITKEKEIQGKKCSKEDGFYADYNSNCENYFLCMFSGTTMERIIDYSCPAGLLFDDKLKICNWANLVTCVL